MNNPKSKKSLSEVVGVVTPSQPLHVVRELTALLLWGIAFVNTFVIDLFTPMREAAPQIDALIRYRFLVVLGAIAIAWMALSKQRFIAFVGYIIAYPLVLLLWRIPSVLFRNWPTVVIFLPTIQAVFRNLKVNFIAATIALIAAVVVLKAQGPFPISTAMILLGAYLALHFGRRIQASFSPSTVFADVGKGLKGFWEHVKKQSPITKLDALQPGTPEHEKVFGQNVLNLYLYSTFLARIANRLRRLHETRKLDLYFALSLLYTFVLTIFVFTLLYFGLSHLTPSSFSERGSFGGFLSYSFGTLTHYQLSPIVPRSAIAQFLTYAEVFASIVIGLLLVFIVFTSARERYRADIEATANELSAASEGFEVLIAENSALTVRAVEYRLLKINEHIAKYLLRLRYGEDAAKQIEEGPAKALD